MRLIFFKSQFVTYWSFTKKITESCLLTWKVKKQPCPSLNPRVLSEAQFALNPVYKKIFILFTHLQYAFLKAVYNECNSFIANTLYYHCQRRPAGVETSYYLCKTLEENNPIKADQWTIPERASSACEQRHGGIPQQHPTDDCEPDSVGSRYTDPGWRYLECELHHFKHGTERQLLEYTWNIMMLHHVKPDGPVCTQWACWRPVWPLRWLWRSCVARVHQLHPSLSSTSRSHWLTPELWHR